MARSSGISYQLQGETNQTPEAIRRRETEVINFILFGTRTSHVSSGISTYVFLKVSFTQRFFNYGSECEYFIYFVYVCIVQIS